MQLRQLFTAGALCAALASPAMADFVSDEFTQQTLGSHWTWNPGTSTDISATPSSYALTGSHLTIEAAKSSMQSWAIDNAAYVAQDDPDAAQWEIVVKIDNYAPTQPEFLNTGNVGLTLHQDNNHWIQVVLRMSSGNMIRYGQSQFDPNGDLGNTIVYKHENTVFDIGDTITLPSAYLKLRRTHHGYSGWFSLDNENWQSVTPLIRNPHSADGAINGTVRIWQSSDNSDGTVQPLEVDWIRKTDLSAPVYAFANDEFDGTELHPRWEFIPGHGGGVTSTTYNMTTGTAALSGDGFLNLVSGPGTDLSHRSDIANGERGLTITQNAPTDEQYSLYTRVLPDVFASAVRFRSHGIRIWQNHQNWLMITAGKSGHDPNNTNGRNRIEVLYKGDDNTTRASTVPFVSADMNDPAPQYLRLDRDGDRFRAQYSFDGVTWTAAFTDQYEDGWVPMVLQSNQPLKVQLIVKRPRYNDAGSTFETSQFDYIRAMPASNVSDWQLY